MTLEDITIESFEVPHDGTDNVGYCIEIGDKTFSVNESTKTGVFAMICGCIWTGLFNSIQLICRERAIIKREHRTGLHISSYVIARLIFDFALCAAEAIILTASV